MLGVSGLMGPRWESKGFFRRGGVLDGWLTHSSAMKCGWWKCQSLGPLLLHLPWHSLFTWVGSYHLLSRHCQRVHGDPQSLPSTLSASPWSPSLPPAQFREYTQRMPADESKAAPHPRPGFLSPPLAGSMSSHPSHPSCFVWGGDEDRWPKSTPAFPTWQSIRSFTLNHWPSSSPRVTVTWRATGPMPSPPTCFHLEASSTWLHSALHSLVCSHQPSASSLIFLRPWRCRNPHDFIVSSVNSSWHFNSSLALLPNIIFTLKGGNRERGRFKCLLQHLIILPEAVTLICKRKVILPASGVAQWYNGGNSPLLNQLESAQGCLQCSAPSHPSALVFCSHSWSHQAAPTPGLYRVLSIAFMPCSLPPPTPPQPPAPSLSITAWFIWNKCTPASHSDETLHSWGFPTILDEVQYLPPGL